MTFAVVAVSSNCQLDTISWEESRGEIADVRLACGSHLDCVNWYAARCVGGIL